MNNKYRNIKTILLTKLKDEKIPFNNKIFLWFLSIVFFNFFFKKKINNDVGYFDYLFTNNMLKDHSMLSDVVARVGWITYKEKSWGSFLDYELPKDDIPNQHFFTQTRKMQGIVETGSRNEGSDDLYIENYKNGTTFAQQGSFVPLVYNTNPLEDTQYIEKSSSIFRIHWTSFSVTLIIYFLEILFLFSLVFFFLDFYIYFDGFCWNIFELANQYPTRFIWANLELGSYTIYLYEIMPNVFKITILFIWHLWYYSKFLFFLFFLIFVNFLYALISFIVYYVFNFFLKFQNISVNSSNEGYFGDFSQHDFSENFPEFRNRGASLFRATDNNNGMDTPDGEVTQLNRGHVEDNELADDFFIFYKDKNSILKMRPIFEFLFFFKSFILIFFFFFWYIFLFLFIIFTGNYFFYSVFRFIIFDDVYKYTFFNYIFGHVNFFPLLDWFYQFEIKMKKIYNQRFFLEKYTNYIFSKGYAKLHYFFLNKDKNNHDSLKLLFGEIKKYNKELLFPRRMKSKRYFYKSLVPMLPDIDKYFKNGIASKRLLFDFVFFKKYTSFQNKIPLLASKDNVNYYIPNKTRMWLINIRFKDFFTYIYDFFTGSFFFKYLQFTNFKFSSTDDLTLSRLMQLEPQDVKLYKKKSKKTVIYSLHYDIPVTKASTLKKTQNKKRRVTDIFLEGFNTYGTLKTPEILYKTVFYTQKIESIKKFFQSYYNYVFLYKNSYRKDFYNNLYRLNFKFEELFESLEHETDLFFDFSKRNLHASDISGYLKNYWKQYTVIRNYKVKKLKTTMKLNNFFIRSRLQFLKMFTKFEVENISTLYNKKEDRKLYDAFSFYSTKYLKNFLRFYGLFQFNSFLRNNKYISTDNFYKHYDLVKLKYFRNLELWKIFQFKTSFQHIIHKLNSRSFLGYYCNSNNTFPFVKYRDHFKSDMRKEITSWIMGVYKEERLDLGESILNPKKMRSRFSFGLQKKVTPLNYVFFFENDSWRNYKYDFKQKFIDNSPKFLVSSGFFNSYYFLVKYIPRDYFNNKTIKNLSFFSSNVKFNFFLHDFLNSLIDFFFLVKKKFFFVLFVWQWLFFFFVLFLFNKIIDDSSFVHSNSRYFYKNVKDSIFILNFLISFFFFFIVCFFLLLILYLFVKILNYFSGNLIVNFLHNIINYIYSFNFKITFLKNFNISSKFKYVSFFSYFFVCVLIYFAFFNNIFFTYKKVKTQTIVDVKFRDFSLNNIKFLDFFKKEKNKNKENNILFNSVEQLSYLKSLKKKKK